MKQGYMVLQKREYDFVVCLLLCLAEFLYPFWMGLITVVQSAHLYLIALQNTTLDECLQHRHIGMRGVEQFFSGDAYATLFFVGSGRQIVVEQLEKGGKHVLLLFCPRQHVHGNVLCLLGTEVLGKTDVGLCAWLVVPFIFYSGRKRCPEHIPQARPTIMGYPLPPPAFFGQQH